MTGDERERELVGLVRVDYDAALRTMTGFITTAGQLRGFGIATWSVVFGLAIRDDRFSLSLLATAVVALFWYADAYHSALYRRALSRVLTLEALLGSYVDRLGIDANREDQVEETLARLETHRFGANRTLSPPAFGDVFRATPVAVFRAIYPALLAASIVATIANG